MKREDSPIRVAHVIGKLNAAGVEAVVNNYYRHIDRTKYQFDYFVDADGACEPPRELIEMGARYFVIPPYQKLPQHIRALTAYFRENQYRIVHSGMNTLAPISLFCAWRAGVPIRINHNHSVAGKGETKRNILKYMLRPFARCFATHCCACSKKAGEWLFGKKAVEQGKVTVFNNAVEVERFKYDPAARAEMREALDLGDSFTVGHVGRFCFAKNHEFLIEIFSALREKHPDSKLLLVGIGESMADIQKKVEALGLTDCVRFLGARNDVNRLYQAMDVFVLPSRYEGLPVVLVEAQCAGLPAIVSSNVTTEAKATDCVTFLDTSAGAQAWAAAIESSSAGDRNVRIDERFDIAVQAKKLERYYDDCLAGL